MQTRNAAPYLYYGQTTSLCEHCLAPVPAKIQVQGDQVYFHKRCPAHGTQKTLVSSDFAYYKLCKEYLKPGDRPQRYSGRTEYGCPYDCGLCPDHEQHSCLAILEVTDHCNLSCPVCFADSSPARGGFRTLDEIETMLDYLVECEGEPDLLQISGGEPTLHPRILEILRLAKRKPIRHLMLNTNGLRLAQDPEFVRALAELGKGFEVYLQFDSLNDAALQRLRGASLADTRRRALENLEQAGIATTLVVVVKRGVNDHELGDILRHATRYRCVRGITFQPIQDAGRNLDFDKRRDRVLLSDIRRLLIEQGGPFGADDLVPLPCNPEMIAIGYALRNGEKIQPVTALFPRDALLADAPNAVTFEKSAVLKQRLLDLLSLSSSGERAATALRSFLCCLPQVEAPETLGYDSVFRVAIVEFMDKYNFCVGGVKRSCIHFVTPERQMIPFDTYNLFYREGLEPAGRERP